MAILLQDSFDRANNTTSLGSPDVGGPYTVQSGTWGINNGEAYLSAPSAGAQVTFPAAFNVDISFKNAVGVSSSVGSGIMFRWADVNNFWTIIRTATGFMALSRCIAGVATAVATDVPLTTGDIFRVVAHGDQIAWYLNGAQRGVLTDSWAANTSATVAGLRNWGSATGRWDDLLVQDQADPINYWGASPVMEPAAIAHGDATFPITPSLYKGRDTATADESEIP